jgi:hypothetical protein
VAIFYAHGGRRCSGEDEESPPRYGIRESGKKGVMISINSQLASKLPVPYDHFNKLYAAAHEIVKHCRAKKGE